MRYRVSHLVLSCLPCPAFAQTFAPLVRPYHFGNPSAFDTLRRRLVVFGDDATTWELAGGELLPRANLDGSPTPPARIYHSMCYDEARRHVLMFGGQTTTNSATLINDTWIYDGNKWIQLTTGPTPSARRFAAITWDSARNRVLMCGPIALGNQHDTWEHDGTTWLQRTTTLTSVPRAMTFDRQRGVAVMVTLTGETWEWNGIDWSQRALFGPSAYGMTLTFDRLRNVTVLAGGESNNRIWEWNGAGWSTSAPLPQVFRRVDAASWFDPDSGRVTIGGGTEYRIDPGILRLGAERADQWQWNGQTLSLLHIDVGPRSSEGMLMSDPSRGRVIHFGGRNREWLPLGETYAFNGRVWTPVPTLPGPSPRWGSAVAYDLIRGESLLFGGLDFSVFFGDTWSIAESGWVARSTTGPTPRAGAAMAADPLRGVVVLFGGNSDSLLPVPTGAVLNDTWEWNGTAWTQRLTAAPPARTEAGMAFHPQLGRLLLFGGRMSMVGQHTDTWTWNGTQWSALPSATVPPPLGAVSMNTNLSTNSCTLVGFSGVRQQVWSHNGTNWVLVLEESAPLTSRWFPCAVSPTLDTLVCTGDGAMAVTLTHVPGQVGTVGAGCGTPTATLMVRSRPRVGATTGLELVANPNRAVVFALDLAGGNTPLGGGCTLWLSPGFLALCQVSDVFGLATQQMVLPDNPALRCLNLFAQAVVLEPQSSIGFVLTQGLQLTLGD